MALGKQWQLKYLQPAREWTEAMPLGNGRLAAMVFGGVPEETFQLNEETVWSGHARDRVKPEGLKALPEVRRLLFEGKNAEASRLAEKTMLAEPLAIESYQPLASLLIRFDQAGDPVDYTRTLDLNQGRSMVKYSDGKSSFTREAFISAPDQVLVIRLATDAPEGLACALHLSREKDVSLETVKANRLVLAGQIQNGGVHFRAEAEIRHKGGVAQIQGGELAIKGAGTVEILVAGAGSYVSPGDHLGADPAQRCGQVLQAAGAKSFEQLLAAHTSEYRSLFDRLSLDLGDSGGLESVPTDERLSLLAKGGKDPGLAALFVQYYRYLLIASSRPGCLPSNLQGKWNDKMAAPWNSDYHPNINLQINYWAAEACNLGECHLPLIGWMRQAVPFGERTARELYGSRGWVMHHVSDIFGCTEPMDGLWGLWPVGGAWLCRHAWEHYLYSGDRIFLEEQAFPLMKGAAEFMLDYLVTVPHGREGQDLLVTNPSHSPENSFRMPDGSTSVITYGATMDLEICHDLFSSCLEAIEALPQASASNAAFRARLEAALEKLAPLKISPRTGAIQEWIADYEETDPGHRHISHMYGVFPGSQITLESPDLAAAAKQTLLRRTAGKYDAQAWSLGWMANVWARLGEGDRAETALESILARHTFRNLFVNAHGNPQVGDGHAFPAAVTEMLAQSHAGEIALLPALPQAWPRGSVRGLRVRGGFEIDMDWEDARLHRLKVLSTRGGLCRLKIASGGRLAWERGRGRIVDADRAEILDLVTGSGADYSFER